MDGISPLSKSSIGDFFFCAWFLYAIRILKRQKEVGVAAMNGIATHKLIQQIIAESLELAEAIKQAENSAVQDLLTLTNTWWPLDKLREMFNTGNLLVEETAYVTRTGRRVKTKRSALVTGIVDLAFPTINGVAHIDDWKSGKWEQDDERERNIYAGVIAPAMFPDAHTIHFTLRFMRTGHTLNSTYQFSDTKKTVIITDPAGETTVRNDEINPLLKDIKNIDDQVKAAKPVPRPGAHCKKHYGQPCQFYADGSCPYWSKKLKENK